MKLFKMKISLLIAIVLFSFLRTNSFSQVRTRTYFSVFENQEFFTKRKLAREHTIPISPEFGIIKDNYKTSKNTPAGNYLYKVAIPLNVNINMLKEAAIVKSEDTVLYILKLKVPTVYSLSFNFSDFFLSKNATVYIYSDREVTGPITEKQNNLNNFWSTILYHGAEVIIELKMPLNEANQSRLLISKAYLGYVEGVSGEYSGLPGNSANCNRNVACPEGVPWDNEKYLKLKW